MNMGGYVIGTCNGPYCTYVVFFVQHMSGCEWEGVWVDGPCYVYVRV